MRHLGPRTGLVALTAAGTACAATAAVWSLPPGPAALVVFLGTFAGCWALLTLALNRRRQRGPGWLGSFRQVGGGNRILGIYDAETGLCADWYFRLRLQEETGRSKRTGQPFALLLAEGRHRPGTKAGARLVEGMAKTFRGTDIVGRLDDLRFGVLLIGADPKGAQAARDRLFSHLPGRDIRVRIAVYPNDGQEWRALLEAAGASPKDFYAMSGPDWSPAAPPKFKPRRRRRRGRAA
jgi:GGDEF domain-containing protein